MHQIASLSLGVADIGQGGTLVGRIAGTNGRLLCSFCLTAYSNRGSENGGFPTFAAGASSSRTRRGSEHSSLIGWRSRSYVVNGSNLDINEARLLHRRGSMSSNSRYMQKRLFEVIVIAQRFLKSVAVVATISVTELSAEPMTFREASVGGVCAGCVWFAAEGDITSDTPAAFREAFGEPAGSEGGPTILINSDGGDDLAAALELGRLFRAHSVRIGIGDTVADPQNGSHVSKMEPGKCLSACAYAFLGGRVRSLDGPQELGFHQFYDADILANADKAAFSGAQRLRDQYVVGELISYLVEMDVSTELFSFAATASPGEFAYMEEEQAAEFRVVDDPRAMRPWDILPLASGLMIESRSVDQQKAVRFFCLGRETGRVHVQIMNASEDGSQRLTNEYVQGTPDRYFFPRLGTFESELRYPSGQAQPLKLGFNRILSEPESGFHVNFDFTMSEAEFRAVPGANHLYFWPGHAYVLDVNFWGQFVASKLPAEMDSNLTQIVLGNCV